MVGGLRVVVAGCTCEWWWQVVLVYGGVSFIIFYYYFLKLCRSVIFNFLMCCDIKIEHLMKDVL